MMAGGGNSELLALKDQIDGMIAKIEARIVALEKRVPAGRPPGGGTSGRKKRSAGKKGK